MWNPMYSQLCTVPVGTRSSVLSCRLCDGRHTHQRDRVRCTTIVVVALKEVARNLVASMYAARQPRQCPRTDCGSSQYSNQLPVRDEDDQRPRTEPDSCAYPTTREWGPQEAHCARRLLDELSRRVHLPRS